LFAWKKLHEARIDRKRSSIYTKCGWIERIRVLNSFLFDVPIDCELGKGTVLQGEMGTGKTALSQWVATLRTRRYVRRWQTFRPFSETRLAIRYHTQEAIRLAEIRILKDTVEFYLDGTIQFQPPEDIAIVSFPERWYEQLHETHSSVEFMQKLFEIDRPQLSSLCAEIERSGGASARNFRLDQDEDGYWQLRGSLEGTVPNLSFFQWSTSEQIRALVELSMSLARLLAVSKPTLLVLDSGGWNWSDPLYDCYSEYLGRQPFQTLFIMNLGRPTSSPQWNQWRSYELVGAWRSGRPSRLKKLNNETGET
jgi:tRNA A37 threonylcarbamoyladenosine biosynthesis protein TsaE